MMPAAKHGDPQMGVDVHLCTVPPGTPAPLPTPHTSIVFDPFDYVPILGATVTVCGMKRATAGTNATVIHIPPGFPFAPKLPDKDDELFMGSATVVADGDPFSFISVPVLGCQVAGMPSPPRPRKKGPPKAMLLPTTFNLAIPTNVFVGGPPTISMLGMLMKGAFAALGKFMKSGLFRRMRQRLFRGLNPGFLKCVILRAEPVNILTGDVSVDQEDFSLPGRIPIQWTRTYSSGTHKRNGLCGPGWETPADGRLEVDSADGTVSLHYPGVGPLVFARLPVEIGDKAAELELMDGALLSDHGGEYRVRTKEDRIYHFPKNLISARKAEIHEFPLGRISDLCGNWLEFTRRSGQLSGIQESNGRYLEIDLENGRISSIALRIPDNQANHVLVRYEYDKAGDLVTVRDALGNPYIFAYDVHHMVRHTDRNGLSFYYEYDTSVTDEWRIVHAWGDGGLYDYRFQYFDEIDERRITDSLGNVSIVKLNEIGFPINEIDPLGGMTIYEYDEAGRTSAVVDPDGNRTEYAYDECGNLLKLTRPDSTCIRTEFDAANKAVAITDPNGAAWQQKWDPRGLLVERTSPLGNVSRYEYDAYGQLVGLVNPLETRTALAFDNTGNLTRLTDALGHATIFNYDLLGNVIAKTDALGHITRYGYDTKSRLTQAVLPSGATISCAYDPEDNLILYLDENGAGTRLEYYGQGEIKRRIQADGHTTEYHYDTEERLIGVTNQRGETYHLKRDALGRIVEEVDYWGQARNYGYTLAGHLKESIDPLGQIITYETDPLGRIVKKVLPDPTIPESVQTESFEYDANGNLVTCENTAIRIKRTFNPEGLLLEEHQGEECTVANVYDGSGNRIERTTTCELAGQRHAHTVRYNYDALDRAIRVEVEGHAPIELNRNALGQLTQEILSASVKRHLDYSPDGYLTAQHVLTNEGPVCDQSFHYDPVGNLIEKRDSAFGVEQFTYDLVGQVIAHLNPQGRLKRYLNDPADDRLAAQEHESKSAYDSDWRRDGKYEGTHYSFDRAGNLTERQGQEGILRLAWDANQRLIESRTNGKTTVYQYDPIGRRTYKQTGNITTFFYWDGDMLLGDAKVEIDEEGSPALKLVREWLYYPGTFEPLALVQKSGMIPVNDGAVALQELYLYHNDPNGCPTRLMDTKGEIVWAAQYRVWGEIKRLGVNRVDNPIRLQGQYRDSETALYYNQLRYYEPLSGFFISSDPLALLGGINPYIFAPNVLMWTDEFGLRCHPLKRRVDQIHAALDEATQQFRTTAIARVRLPDGRIQRWVATSSQYMPAVQQSALRSRDWIISGVGHAETTILDRARIEGAQVLEIAASRPICPDCARAIRRAGATPVSALK